MFIEDIITEFAERSKTNDELGQIIRADDWTLRFVQSLHQTVLDGRSLSTRQVSAFVNVIGRVAAFDDGESVFAIIPRKTLEAVVASPRCRRPVYESTPIEKEVRYLGDNKLGFRFQHIADIISDIKGLSQRGRDSAWKIENRPKFNRQFRMWVVPVTRDTYPSIMKMISKHSFAFDDAVAEYLTLCENSRNQPSNFILDTENSKIVVNLCDNPVLSCWMKHVVNGEIL